MPKALFKFSTAAGALAVMEYNSVFVTSPLDLNDPFEMRPAWTNEHEQRDFRNRLNIAKMTEGAPLFIAMQGDKAVRGGTMPFLEPHAAVDVETQRGVADTHNSQIFRQLHHEYRVLSFAGSLFDLAAGGGESDEQTTLLWSHYADQFQGICLAIDPERFHNGMQEGGYPVHYDKLRQSLPASYYDTFPPKPDCFAPGYIVDPETNLAVTKAQYEARKRQHFISFLTRKSPAWAYENEVRMIYELGDLRATRHYRQIPFACQECMKQGGPQSKCPNCTFRDAVSLPAEAILAVIFGAECSPEALAKVEKLLERPEYSHVELYWSSHHSARYVAQYAKDEANYARFIQRMRAEQVSDAKGHTWWNGQGMQRRHAAKGTNFLRVAPEGQNGSH